MLSLVTDHSVIASVITAAALALGLVAGGRFSGRKPPTWAVWLPSAIVGLAVARVNVPEFDVSRYLDPTIREYRWWTGPVATIGFLLHVGGVMRARNGGLPDPTGGRPRMDLGPYVAGATCGIFLCVPETMLLQVLVGPIAIAVIASVGGRLRTLGRAEAIVIGAGLAWIAVVDGQSRPTAVIGAAGALAATGLLAAFPSGPRPTPGGRSRVLPVPRVAEVTVPVAAVLVARLGGLRPTPAAATMVTIVILVGAAVVLLLGERRSGSPTASDLGRSADAVTNGTLIEATPPESRRSSR